MSFWKWSRTASANASADASIDWAEGQPPSSVNDSARAMMAAAAKYRDDVSGAIVTAGSSTAYTLSTFQLFDSLAHLDGAMIAFTPHATNGATVTLNVDSTGAKPLRAAPNIELPSGALIQGTPYVVTYTNSDGVFYLQGGAANPYNIPLGGLLPYVGASAPNSAFALPYGQAISRATYAGLFSLVSTTFGAGDGSTTFNLPDLRGRVPAGLDNMGGSAASRLTSIGSGTTLGAVGGEQAHSLSAGEMPAHQHSGTTSGQSNDHVHNWGGSGTANISASAGGLNVKLGSGSDNTAGTSADHTHTFTTSSQGGSAAHNNLQPTILTNYILRII